MKIFIPSLILFVFVATFGYSATIDPALSEQMAQNPELKLHVIAYFNEKLTPEKVVEEMGIKGDEMSILNQVVEIYKNKSQNQLCLFAKNRQLENLWLHELLQAISFKANAEIIRMVALIPEIRHIALFTPENSKPDNFFLKKPYYEFNMIKVTEVGNTENGNVSYVPVREGESIDPDQIINILKKIYDFIKENQPVVNTAIDQASAVPAGITHWQQLAGWQEKHTGQYVIEYVNLYGITVVKIVLKVHFFHHGNYNGIGKYITSATSSIDEMNVLWGYTLNATVAIPDSGIVNIGTSSNPVAGMKMFINWKVHTIIQHQEGTMTFFLDGNGNISSS